MATSSDRKRNLKEFLRRSIVGQEDAIDLVADKIVLHDTLNSTPLVLAFAGLSGHGKTAMTLQLDNYFEVPSHMVDCPMLRETMQVFGPPTGYVSNEIGSPLNNFLDDNQGRRCVVFLEHWDCTTPEVREALLEVMGSGQYLERRRDKTIDCSKVIWLLTANTGDKMIENSWRKEDYLGDRKYKYRESEIVSSGSLQGELRLEHFYLYGSKIITPVPFLPFTYSERIDLAKKFLLDASFRFRNPTSPSPPTPHLISPIELVLEKEDDILKHLATKTYDSELGGWSILHAVDDLEVTILNAYLKTDKLRTEDQSTEKIKICVRDDEIRTIRLREL